MKKFCLIFLIIIGNFLLSSCIRKAAVIFPNRPDDEMELGDVSPDFKKGYDDGCETGMAAGSNTFYKTLYRSNAVDGYKMSSSSDYKSGWGIGWWYCYRFDYLKQRSGLYGSFFRGYH